MYNAKDLAHLVCAITKLKRELGVYPCVRQLAEELHVSEGSVEHRARKLIELGLLKSGPGYRLAAEKYVPPKWAVIPEIEIKKRMKAEKQWLLTQ